MDAPEKVRFVRVDAHRARRLLEEHPKVANMFGDGKYYDEDWLLEHVRTGAMEFWNILFQGKSVGIVSGYTQSVSKAAAYFIWCFYVSPKLRGIYSGTDVVAWLKDRARHLGCSSLEFVTHRNREAAIRRAAAIGFEPVYLGFRLEVE